MSVDEREAPVELVLWAIVLLVALVGFVAAAYVAIENLVRWMVVE